MMLPEKRLGSNRGAPCDPHMWYFSRCLCLGRLMAMYKTVFTAEMKALLPSHFFSHPLNSCHLSHSFLLSSLLHARENSSTHLTCPWREREPCPEATGAPTGLCGMPASALAVLGTWAPCFALDIDGVSPFSTGSSLSWFSKAFGKPHPQEVSSLQALSWHKV